MKPKTVVSLMDYAHKRVLEAADKGQDHTHAWAVYSYGLDWETLQRGANDVKPASGVWVETANSGNVNKQVK